MPIINILPVHKSGNYNKELNNPESFDGRKEWKECKYIGNVRDQGHCKSCWAFASSEVLGDRVCIASKGKYIPLLSPQELVSCDYFDKGCDGDIPSYLNEWDYITEKGIVDDKCLPYSSYNGTVEKCSFEYCKDGKTKFIDRKYKAKSYKHVGWFPIMRTTEIETEIVSNGPVEMGFHIYEDFMQYKSGVYRHITGDYVGDHAVKGIGYGKTSNGEEYWIIVNSWSENWGQKGIFFMKKGSNECNIERNVYSCVPDLDNVPYN